MIKSDNLKGAQMMTITMFGFALSDMAMKILDMSLPLFELFFLRGFFVVSAFAALLYASKAPMPRTKREWVIMIARGITECAVAYFFFKSLEQISLTNVTTILQLIPLVMTVIAYLFYGERFGIIRLLCVLIGFLGVIFVVQPTFSDLNLDYAYALLSMALIAFREILTRQLPPETSSNWTAFVLALCIIIMGAFGTLLSGEWIKPTVPQIGLLALASACVMTGYISSVKAMRIGDVSFVSGFRYSGILFVILIDIFVFKDAPNFLTIVGCILIAGAGIYSIRQEQKTQS